MVKLAVEKIRDLQIRSTVNLERYSEGVRRKVIGILNDTQDGILAELMKQDTKVPITEWRKGRLTNLQKTIDGIADKSYGKIKRITNKDLNSVTSFTAKETVGNLNKVIGVEIANVTLTPEGLKSIVSNTMIDGQVIGKWWDEQKGDFKRKAARQMADATHAVQLGLVKGEGINELVRRIRGTALAPGIMDMSKRNATSLVRTSVMQVANEARMDMYEGNKDLIDGYEFVATLDKRTSTICRAYDGKQWIEVDGKLRAKGHRLVFRRPPLHWQCRSTMIPILKSFADLAGPKSTITKSKIRKLEKLSPTQRASMTYDEKLLGIGKPVSGGMTYNDWLLTQSEAVQIDVLGPGRFRLWKKHKLSMADMVNQKGRPLSIVDLEKKYVEVGEKVSKWVLSDKISIVKKQLKERFGIKTRPYKYRDTEQFVEDMNIVGEEFQRLEDIYGDSFKRYVTKGKPTKINELRFFDDEFITRAGVNSGASGAYDKWEKNMWVSFRHKMKHELDIGGHNVGVDTRSILRHEFGHHTYNKMGKSLQRKWDDLWNTMMTRTDFPDETISFYATANADEGFAEAFSAFTSPLYKKGDLLHSIADKKIENFFKELLKG